MLLPLNVAAVRGINMIAADTQSYPVHGPKRRRYSAETMNDFTISALT